MLDSSGAMASVNASIVAITAALRPVRVASPIDMVALSAPAVRTPAVAAKIAAASEAGSPAASATEPTAAAVEASTAIGRTIVHAPGTRAPNNANRDRPVAARSRNTPDSRSLAPAVAPTMAPTTSIIMVSTNIAFW